ncbi:DUF1801 domain-containing protein [Fulvivirgaceae bacterium BMA10]|uniref:DUF1801 domain-containing protein n=1 Tax=Splendidivirga corallicola TaxID=3051826 RepID=A0ABT8KPY3_9BACT|nr:DUF1801 domain-containing protein [Fulvivirgaceae bacterium BMA10]
MKTLVNTETNKSVPDFMDAIANKRRQADSRELLQIIQKITGKEPKIWGVGILGFGKYKYQRKNGDEYEWFNVGFSPGKAHLTVYVMYDINEEQELLQQLGPHKTGKGCLYIKRLEDVDTDVLKKIIAKSDRWR